jgi:hypothetical protein
MSKGWMEKAEGGGRHATQTLSMTFACKTQNCRVAKGITIQFSDAFRPVRPDEGFSLSVA